MKLTKNQIKKLIREEKELILLEDRKFEELSLLAEEAYLLNENKMALTLLKPLFKEAGKQIVPILLELLKEAGKETVEELVGELSKQLGASL